MKIELKHPLLFKPLYKQVIWGGHGIAAFKGVEIPLENVGESWEISAVPGHESVVADGQELAGRTLPELVEEYGAELLGKRVMREHGGAFPLLVKIIDARRDLSVQVHPDDALAMRRHGCRGKSEMWYILHADEGARIHSGLRAPLRSDDYDKCVAENRIMDYVGHYESRPGQFYYVPAGTLHAIGAGNLVAEIQESSDITYRVYDYDRRDASGQPRELHTEQARDAINYAFPSRISPTAEAYGCSKERAVDSELFKVDYISLGEGDEKVITSDGETFAIAMVADGVLTVASSGKEEAYRRGMTLLLPAALRSCRFVGPATVLLARC